MAEHSTFPLRSGERPTHPLRNWRQTQRRIDHASRAPKNWTVADAARLFGSFVGSEVPYQTWMAWELYEGEPGARRPSSFYMEKLFLFTRGAIRPDNFYPIGEWRKRLAEAAEAADPGAEPAGEA
jgi:hypothetical protein